MKRLAGSIVVLALAGLLFNGVIGFFQTTLDGAAASAVARVDSSLSF